MFLSFSQYLKLDPNEFLMFLLNNHKGNNKLNFDGDLFIGLPKIHLIVVAFVDKKFKIFIDSLRQERGLIMYENR